MSDLSMISLFTGAMGMDLGFELEGFEPRICVDSYGRAAETIAANRPYIPVLQQDIAELSTEEILERAGLKRGEADVLIGGPPCEPFSTAGRRNGFRDGRAIGIHEFIRVIVEAQPKFFVMEQVPGFLRIAKRHMSFYERARKRPKQLRPEERLGSGFKDIMEKFIETGYTLTYSAEQPSASTLNAADFGTPQKRKRFILIGAQNGSAVPLPVASHDRWVTLREGLDGLDDSEPEYVNFPSSWAHFLKYVSPGGCWRDLPEELHREALGGAYDDRSNPITAGLKGGRTGFLRRLSWDAPAPTLVDRPTTRAGCLAHPEQGWRPLSVNEYARLQGFPDDWTFCGPTSVKYRLAGQATPVALARAVAREVRTALAERLS